MTDTQNLHIGFSVFEQSSIEEPDTVYKDDIKVLELLYGFSTEQMELSLKQGRAENDAYIIEPLFAS